MSHDTKQLLSDLNKLLGQLESAVHAARGSTSEAQGDTTAEPLKDALNQARGRIEGLRQNVQDEFEHGIKATDQWVRDQPWVAVGIAAAIAFALGIVLGRRD